MAIPFAVPSDEQGEAALGQLLLELIDINQQIQILLCSRAQNQITSVSPRVSTPRRTRNQPREDQERMPDLANNNMPIISSSLNARTDLDIVILLSAASQSLSSSASDRRRRRQRTSSESSNCEESKDSSTSLTDIEDWTQVGDFLPKIGGEQLKEEDAADSVRCQGGCRHECSKSSNSTTSSSLLSKLVPTPIKSSIWTAVICIVGWHLFRAR